MITLTNIHVLNLQEMVTHVVIGNNLKGYLEMKSNNKFSTYLKIINTII
jgi:hypothetical protein